MKDIAADQMTKHKSSFPHWIQSKLTEQEALNISEVVGEVEAKTSAEIVPVIVRRSSSVGHVGVSLFFSFFAIFMLLEYFVFNGWLLNFKVESEFIWAFIALVMAWFLRRLPFFQTMFVPHVDAARSVLQRAELEFHRQKVNATTNKSGVLIFISMFERKAVILADETVSRALPNETWTRIVRDLVVSFSSRDWEAGLATAIRQTGEVLSTHFPPTGKSKNELSNSLRIID